MSVSIPNQCVPFRWPAAWKDEQAAGLLTGTPVNCVLDAPSAIASALKSRGLTAISKEEAAGVASLVPDPVWPSVQMARKGEGADAGPTGAPWVDANGWSVRLMHALFPAKPVWVDVAPPAGTVLDDSAYLLSIAEPAVYGGRAVINLDDGLAKSLAANDPAATGRWRRILGASQFFEDHRAWSAMEARSNLAVLSDFSGDNEFMAKEFLNLAARRSLFYRIVVKKPDADLQGAAAVLYVDEQPPAGALHDRLRTLVRSGAMLIGPKSAGLPAWGGDPGESPVPGYEVRRFGRGRLVMPSTPWEDPWTLALEVRMLIGRRTDVLRLYNTGIMGAHYTRSKDGSAGVVHLLNYARRAPAQAATVAPGDNFSNARVVSLDGTAKMVPVTQRREAFSEIALPPFNIYCAVELGR
jgi:hypothetical protein